MHYYQLPQSDLKLSRLAYGTWHFGGTWDKTPLNDELKKQTAELILTAVDSGINHIDLADIYTLGKSDEAVGLVLRDNPGLREKVVLQEKFGIIVGFDDDFGQPSRYDFSYKHLISSLERCLKRLHTDYVDIITLHRPDPLVEYEEVAKAFDFIEAQGMARHFGVSNHSAAQIQLLKRYVRQNIVVNQLELNLLHHHLIADGILVNQIGQQDARSHGLLEYCRLENIMIQAWSPVARGVIFNPPHNAPEHIKATANVIAELATAKQTSKEAIALAWLLRHPMGIQPILGSQSSGRIRESVKADEVELTRQEWYSLLAAARGAGVP